MRLLDLFCGAGGAAVGYSRAGFTEIVGVDIVPQPNYPFTFVQGDALEPPVRLADFDLVHASPPCQAYSLSTNSTGDQANHPRLISTMRELLAGRPHVIENVPSVNIRRDAQLCGSMFGLRVRRHRDFELSGFPLVMTPPHRHNEWGYREPVDVTGNSGGTKNPGKKYADLDDARDAMGMEWITRAREVTEAIPPAYTQYIGEQFISSQMSGSVRLLVETARADKYWIGEATATES